ncbi:Golgi phosphoprotein 3 rotini [Fasciola hepatica]|uniref:Golgi phosphoprotein 3 rotini n=1 Tax=Fasciola hepatica TaxID=6192 RepID=A0A2H1CN13_FASHE|nr:Golgi phosphoprotein 3 rotini [Fasciola hepatica]
MSEASEAVLSRRNVKPLESSSEMEPQEQSQTEEEADSKEVRLTLMEEILLLGLKDREGHLSFWNDSVSCGLRGCIMAELALRGRLALEPSGMRRRGLFSRAVIVKNGVPTGDALLDEALKLVKTNQPENTKTWIDYLSGETWNPFKLPLQMRNVRERIAKNLVEKGVCKTEKQNFVVFDMMTHPLVDFQVKQRVVQRIQDAILNKWSANIHKVDKRLLCLILLAHHSDVLDNALATLSDADYDLARRRVSSALQLDYATEATNDGVNDLLWAILASFNG